MNVFCDMVGHADLAYSIWALFHRVGATVTFPNGDKQWHSHLFTTHLNSPDMLGVRCISLNEFDESTFDIYVSTCHINEQWMSQASKGRGVFIHQINNLLEQPSVAHNVLMGVRHDLPCTVNRFDYIPEHPPRYRPNAEVAPCHNSLTFQQYVTEHPVGSKIWTEISSSLGDCLESKKVPEWELHELFWKTESYAHIKATGCCGFTLREAMFSGLPVLVDTSWSHIYKTPAREYLADQVNCIDLAKGGRTRKESIELLKDWVTCSSRAERNTTALSETRKRINFAQDAARFKDWLLKL